MNDTLFSEDGKPALPYAGSSGWSGSDTSRDRAARNDSDGTTAGSQAQTLELLLQARRDGLTWQELAFATGLHHGGASGVLSVLHKTDQIQRLTAVRNRCKVYVHPLFLDERETEIHSSAKPPVTIQCPHCGEGFTK